MTQIILEANSMYNNADDKCRILVVMAKRTPISGLRPGHYLQTRKGIRERFALSDPLTKPLHKHLSGIRTPKVKRVFHKRPPGINDSRWMKTHSDLAVAKSKRFE